MGRDGEVEEERDGDGMGEGNDPGGRKGCRVYIVDTQNVLPIRRYSIDIRPNETNKRPIQSLASVPKSVRDGRVGPDIRSQSIQRAVARVLLLWELTLSRSNDGCRLILVACRR